MREAVQYIRVSSEEQAKDGHSLPAQEREGGLYAEKEGLIIRHVFRDVQTAKAAGREEFGKVLAFLKKQKRPGIAAGPGK
jgi:DNA invertase Pin-like site-specific DNA recombinase